MPRTMNKYGFPGVRKRNDYSHRHKPYYARVCCKDQFQYSRYFATVEEAAAAYQQIKAEQHDPAVDPLLAERTRLCAIR